MREVVFDVVSGALKEQDARFDQKLHDLRLDVRDEIHSCVSASETRMTKKMIEIKEEIIDGITEIIDEGIFPQISDLRVDVDQIKVRLQMA